MERFLDEGVMGGEGELVLGREDRDLTMHSAGLNL